MVVRTLQSIDTGGTVPVTMAPVIEYVDIDIDTDRGGSFGLFNPVRLIGFGTGPPVAAAVVDCGL